MKDIIRKKLQSVPKYNPFNAEYNYEELNSYISSVNSEESINSFQIAKCTQCYNAYYLEIHNYIKENFSKLSCDTWGTIQTLFAISNRDFYLLSNKVNEQSSGISSVEKISKQKIKSPIEHFGDINITAMVETQIDIINTIINTLKHYKIDFKKKMILQEELLAYITRIYASANMLFCIKTSYDVALWENGYIDIINDNTYHIKHSNLDLRKARVISDIRMQNNLLGTLFVFEKVIKYREKINSFSTWILDKVWIDNKGYINYSARQELNAKINNQYYNMALNEIFTYYPYACNKRFVDIGNLNIQDMLTIYSEISNIIGKIIENYTLNDIPDTDISVFSYKIRKIVLIKYLKLLTNYNNSQINSFLNILECSFENKARFDFWKKPLLLAGNDYHFLSVNLVAPNYSYLVDEWLKGAGYDLEERGKDFERYIKHELSEIFEKHKLCCKIPNKSKFYINTNEYEEVDLIMVLKKVVILAEIKCIRYPMDSRDAHNNFKVLEKAGEQIMRKSKFIIKHKDKFIDDIGDITDKKAIKVIITNYPIFAGMKVNDIPIVDYYLFDSYFRSGKLTHTIMTPHDNTISEEIPYYSNEDELNANLEAFINKPLSISELERNLSLKTQEITFPSATIHIFQDILN